MFRNHWKRGGSPPPEGEAVNTAALSVGQGEGLPMPMPTPGVTPCWMSTARVSE